MLKKGHHVRVKILIFNVFHPSYFPPSLASNSPTAALQLGPNLNSTPLISRIETEPQAECCGPYRSPAEIAAAGVRRKGHGRRSQKRVNPPSPAHLPVYIYSRPRELIGPSIGNVTWPVWPIRGNTRNYTKQLLYPMMH